MSEHQFQAGERVEVSKPIDLLPYTVLVTGEKGTVVRIVNDMGISAIEVEMDTPHEGLKLWDNRALLTYPESSYVEPVRVKQHLQKVVAAFVWGGLATTLGTLKAHAAVLVAIAYGLSQVSL